MIEKGMLERSARGVYILPERLDDEFFNLQNRFKKGVFSNGTALYLLGFSDRTPSRYDMTFPASYNTSSVKNEVVAHRVKKELYEQGIISVKTPLGNSVNVYCIEHTLCDILQERYCMDIQIVTDAYKKYARYKDKNLNQLMEFSNTRNKIPSPKLTAAYNSYLYLHICHLPVLESSDKKRLRHIPLVCFQTQCY